MHVNFDSYVVLFLTLCEGKDANSPVFSLENGEFQNVTVLVTKSKFKRNKSHFLYFLVNTVSSRSRDGQLTVRRLSSNGHVTVSSQTGHGHRQGHRDIFYNYRKCIT